MSIFRCQAQLQTQIMIKDFLISFTDNFKEKTKNPFLGTYLLVWIIRNWDLIYTLFNFDKDCNLEDKKAFITNYYDKNDFINNLFTNTLWTFGLLILTYALLNLSRVIVNLSEKQLTPWVYQVTDSKSIVLKTEYDRIRTENDDLQFRLDKERESKSRLETRIKNLEAEIIEVTRIKAEDEGEKSIELISTDKVEKSKFILDDFDKLINKLKDKKLLKDFIYVCTQINKGNSIPNSFGQIDSFIELGLVKFERNAINSSKNYKITTEGEAVLKKARFE